MDRKEIIEKLKFKYDYRFHTKTGFGEESLFYKVSDLEEDLYEDFLSYIPEHFWTDYLGFYYSIDLCYKIIKGDMMMQIKKNLSHFKKDDQ